MEEEGEDWGDNTVVDDGRGEVLGVEWAMSMACLSQGSRAWLLLCEPRACSRSAWKR